MSPASGHGRRAAPGRRVTRPPFGRHGGTILHPRAGTHRRKASQDIRRKASQDNSIREGARGARPARLAADRSRWLPRPGARSPAECLGTAYRTSAAPLTICRVVSVIRALGIPVQTHHSRPHFARATWQPGPARRSRRGANAPGWKTFSKRTRSVLAEPARSNPKPGKGSRADTAPQASPPHSTGPALTPAGETEAGPDPIMGWPQGSSTSKI